MMKRTSQAGARPSSRVGVSTQRSGRAAADGDPKRGGAPVRKKVRGGGKELMIAGGVIGFLAILALVMYSKRSGEETERKKTQAEQEAIFNTNMQAGFRALLRAESVGSQYVVGKEADITPDKLFGPFRSDDKVYNVIYDRNFKGERQPGSEQKAMFPERLKLGRMEQHCREDGGAKCCYGFVDGTTPVVVATKPYKSAEGDTANLGGLITVIVKADNDRKFENARNPKAKADQ
jgi:hypothetical protein